MNNKGLDMPSFWGGVLIGWGLLVLILLTFLIDDIAAGRHLIMVPNCPVEDSCYPEYFQGQWYIIEGER